MMSTRLGRVAVSFCGGAWQARKARLKERLREIADNLQIQIDEDDLRLPGD